MKKLTSKNYHKENTPYLTSSKIKDYLLNPWYYHQKHVLKTMETEKTDALILGSAVDTYVTAGKKTFNKLFKPVTRRTNEEGLRYTEMTTAAYQEAVAISERVINTTAYRDLSNYERQVVLTSSPIIEEVKPIAGLPDLPSITVEKAKPIAGMLDFLSVEGTVANIVDLKTSRTAETDRYFYHCLDYGYFLQAAMYKKLVLANYPDVKEVNFFHLVVSKENKNFYQVRTFKFSPDIIEEYSKKLDGLIIEISKRTDWSQEDASLEGAILLGSKQAYKAIGEGWETE